MGKKFAVVLLFILGFLITVTREGSQAQHIYDDSENLLHSYTYLSTPDIISQVEDAVPHHHSLKGRLGRIKYILSASERMSGNGLKFFAPQQYVTLLISKFSTRLFYQYKDTLFSFLQGILFPKHFFW